jgi:hypothetical protein
MNTAHAPLVSVVGLARRLGLAANWLRAEAIAGRIPALRAGRRLLFSVSAVERALLDRASRSVVAGAADVR